MTTENNFSKSSHSQVGELNKLLKFAVEGRLSEITKLLKDNSFAEKSLNIALGKAFGVYKASNETSREIIAYLLQNNADPNINIDFHTRASSYSKDRKNTPTFYTGLMNASTENDVQLTKILISYNCDVNLKDNFQRNALFYAINSNNGDVSQIILLLIHSGINIHNSDAEGNTPLTFAVLKGNRVAVKIVLEAGADVNYRNPQDGNTAVHYAVMHNNIEIINTLLCRKPNLSIRNKSEQTALEIAATLPKSQIYQMLAEEFNKIEVKSIDNLSNSPEYCTDNSNSNTEDLRSSHKTSENENYSSFNQFNSTMHNIQININNHNNTGEKKFVNGFTKSAKLQKLVYLQEKRNSEKNDKNKIYPFPSNQNKESFTNIEIPFSFQNNIDKSGGRNQGNQLHTYIKIQSTPVLHIDISDDMKQDQFILSSQLEDLKLTNGNHVKKINQIENDLNNCVEENMSLKNEIYRLKEEMKNKEKVITGLTVEFSNKEAEYINRIEDFKMKLDDKTVTLQCVLEKYERIEKELGDYKSKDIYGLCSKEFSPKKEKELTKKEYLDKKFSMFKYDDKFIIKNLQKDILDFQEYTKDQMRKIKPTQEELIKLIQESVNECMPDFEVRMYGSHATNLCLHYSDLDIVLVHKKNFNANNYQGLQSLYLNLLEKTWKKSIKFIDTAVVPIIKMTSTDLYNSMHIDISVQDNKHYGLKCVELVKQFLKDYEALEPLIFALKNILKNANLNDPYTGGLSSYGLILMVVSFLQNQQEKQKSVKVCDGNIGRLFLEFLWHYGIFFDHTKYVIYAYPPNEALSDKESIHFLYNLQSAHDLIIVDPLSKINNVARSTHQFCSIKMAFMIGFIVSQEECECGCHYAKAGDDCNIYNTEHCILKRIFNSVKRFNANNNIA